MRTLSSVFLLVIVASSLTAAPPAKWEARGVGAGGGLFEPSYSPHNADELWIASDMGTFLMTSDAGASWQRIPFQQIRANSRTPICFTRDRSLMWALDSTPRNGGDTMRPSVSRDGGKTWQRIPHPAWQESNVGSEMVVDAERPNRVLISGEGHQIFFSRDGKTFESVFNTKENLRLAGAAFSDDEILACTSHDGLLRSVDNGKTWQKHPAEDFPRGVAVSTFAAAGKGAKRRLFLVTVENAWQGSTGAEAGGFRGVYVLDPGSNRWEKRTEGLDMAGYYVVASPSNPDVAYVGGKGRGQHLGPAVYRTSDGGKTWQKVFHTERNGNVATGWAGDGNRFNWTWPEYALGLAVAPSDPDRVAVTDLGCIHQTRDGGKTWQQIYTRPTQPTEPGQRGPRDNSFASIGLEVTTCWDVAWLGGKQVFAGFSDICGIVSSDGGKVWAWPRGHDENSSYHVIAHPNGKSYLASSSVHDLFMATHLEDRRIDPGKGSVRVSEDGGKTWAVMKDFEAPVIRLASHPRKPDTLYACVVHSQRGGIYRTEQASRGAAAIWVRLAIPPRTEGHPYTLNVLDDGTLVCTYSGRIANQQFTASSGVFVSTDDGRTWVDRTHPGMRFWTKDLVVDPHDRTQSTWYVGVFHAWGADAREGRSGLYRTVDRGRTWQPILQRSSAPSGVLNVESVAFHPTRRGEMYVTTEYDGLWWTDDLKSDLPKFYPVDSYRFAHPIRVLFNPGDASEVWVTSFGAGLYVGREER